MDGAFIEMVSKDGGWKEVKTAMCFNSKDIHYWKNSNNEEQHRILKKDFISLTETNCNIIIPLNLVQRNSIFLFLAKKKCGQAVNNELDENGDGTAGTKGAVSGCSPARGSACRGRNDPSGAGKCSVLAG
jgi:hypothetical protein